MLGIHAWPVRVMVPVCWPPGPGCRWRGCIWSSWPGRAKPDAVPAAASDLKVLFTVVGKPPEQVRAADVLAFITAQRTSSPPASVVC